MKLIKEKENYTLFETEEDFQIKYNEKFLIGFFKPFTDKESALDHFDYILS